MRKFSFLNYTKEVFLVGKNLNVDIGIAFDRFKADVKAGAALPYNTANALPDFDFAAAKTAWDELTRDEQIDAYGEWSEFVELVKRWETA